MISEVSRPVDGSQAAPRAHCSTPPAGAIAHLTEDGRVHLLSDHQIAVADALFEDFDLYGIGAFMRPMGLVHDLGKASAEWQDGIERIRAEQSTAASGRCRAQ